MKSDSGQTAMLFIFVSGVLLFGVFYILFSVIPGQLVKANNDLISQKTIPYSQTHATAMDSLFRIWWLYPVLLIVLYLYYLTKKGLEKKPEDIYA